MGIFHEVSPANEALGCNDCHGSGTRVDFAALGYTPRAERNGRPLCASCHEDESGEWSPAELFAQVHREHVRGEGIDCSACHGFVADAGGGGVVPPDGGAGNDSDDEDDGEDRDSDDEDDDDSADDDRDDDDDDGDRRRKRSRERDDD